jgi:uncharacterized membrane protein AbrB (regulator of aidB expression)
MKRLWKPKQSVTLSLVVTYLAGAALLAAMYYVPFILTWWIPGSLVIVFLACCPAGWAAIVSLLKLLHNIRRGEVFTRRNVKLLRLLSWCFVFTALAAAYATYVYYPCAVIFAAAGFLAILLRVVKNVMEQATIMREEQELTI